MEKTAKVFKVRLPKEFNTNEKQFYIRKIGSSILLTPTTNSWDTFEQSISEFSDDFLRDGRNQPPMQPSRDTL